MFYYFELIKVTVADGPVSVLPPASQNCPKVRDSWELIIKKLPIPLPSFIVLANTVYCGLLGGPLGL